MILAALIWDLSGGTTEQYPFAATDLARGSSISEDTVEWKQVPTGIFAIPDLSQATASIDIARGDPITQSALSPPSSIPAGWWSVAIDLPEGVNRGATVRVVLPDGSGVSGVVVQQATDDTFGSLGSAAVAFPGGVAEIVAGLAALNDLIVLIEP